MLFLSRPQLVGVITDEDPATGNNIGLLTDFKSKVRGNLRSVAMIHGELLYAKK